MNPITHDDSLIADRIDDAKVAQIDRTLMSMIRGWLKRDKPLTDKMKRALRRIASEQGIEQALQS